MDEIDLGDLDDEARAAARQRRKAINARVEGELEPAARHPASDEESPLRTARSGLRMFMPRSWLSIAKPLNATVPLLCPKPTRAAHP